MLLPQVRVQFHVVTDGHDQMEPALRALLDTLNQLNQPEPELLATDKPFDDKAFFMSLLPSLRAKQAELDGANPQEAPADTRWGLPLARAEPGQIGAVLRSAMAINSALSSLRNQLDALPVAQQVVALDAEWDTQLGSSGLPISQGKVALVQLGYDLQARAPQ